MTEMNENTAGGVRVERGVRRLLVLGIYVVSMSLPCLVIMPNKKGLALALILGFFAGLLNEIYQSVKHFPAA